MKNKSFAKNIPIICLPLFLIGCATTSSTNVSLEDAFISQAEQAKVADSAIQTFRKAKGLTLKEAEYGSDEIWIQPQNITKNCKVFFTKQPSENARIFWDGDCRDGFALGLGRIFLMDQGKDHVIDIEEIAYYEGGKSEPETISRSDRVENTFSIFSYGSKMLSQLATSLKNVDGKLALNTARINNEHLPLTGYSYRLATTSLELNQKIYQRFANKDLYTLFVDYTEVPYNNILQALIQDSAYAMRKMHDGQVVHHRINREPVTLPVEYVDHMVKVSNEMVSKVKEIEPMINKSQNMMNYYLTKICSDSVKVTFMSNERYKEVCSEGGYFAAYMPSVIKAQEEVIERRRQEYNKSINQKRIADEEIKANTDKAKGALEKMIKNITGTNKVLSDGNNAISNKLGTSSNYQTPRINTPNTYRSIGNSIVGSDGTTCSQIGNAIICK